MFSIIVPTYNSASTIVKTLESIAEQSFKNLEVVIVDGLSNDSTIEIIKQYSSKISIQFISEKDKGIYDAMNKGIDLAKNEWIYFLGSDDYLYSNTVLEKVAQEIVVSNCDIIYGNAFNEYFNEVYGGVFDDERMCIENICHQTIFYKKSVLKKKGSYNIHMKVNADIYLNKLLFADKNIKWHYINETIAFYSSSGFSSSHFDKVYWYQAEKFLQKHYQTLVSQKVIYTSLFPLIQYDFSFKSLIVALKASWAYVSIKPMMMWLKHPLSIPRLFFTYKLKKIVANNR